MESQLLSTNKGRNLMKEPFKKVYSVAIDTVPLPEKPADRIEVAMKAFGPVINQMFRDAMNVAIGTWPTPEIPDR
jgi:hypothetical protein